MKNFFAVLTSTLLAASLLTGAAFAQAQNGPRAEVAGIPVNYDEARVGSYTLPAPLVMANGQRVRDARAWRQQRRPELIRLFEKNQFGRSPGRPAAMTFDAFDKGTPAFDGKAVCRQVTVYFSRDKAGPKMDLLVYLPAAATKPVPVLLNISFTANSSAVDDPGVKQGEVWNREKKRAPAPKGELREAEGGAALSRRNYGETIKHLTAPTRFPYQFAANYGKYADRVNDFPVDAHLLVSLIAPRPLLLQTSDIDTWSDPKGEFLAAVAAGPVYRLLGQQDLGTEQMPAAGQPILHTLGYAMHAGGHGTIPSDWELFLKFMQMHFKPRR